MNAPSRMFWLPLAINGTTPISAREIPCAFKPHFHDGVSRRILASLSEHGCQWNFLDWVKNHRPYDTDIEEDELKMCPMIWCRKTFETNDLTIRHVFDCTRLSNAWYWCPYHKWPERFLECNKGSEIIRKPKLHQAAKFFSWFGHKRSVKRQEAELQLVERKILIDNHQGQASKKELGTGTDHQIFESPGSDPQSSNGNHYAVTAGWIDEKESYPGRQSRIAEVYGGEIYRPELAASHKSIARPEMYDSSAPLVRSQRRSSPELLHPINSESDRHSLWQRMRGMPATDPRHSGVKHCRNDWPDVVGPENAISTSSGEDSKLHGNFHNVVACGNEVSSSNASEYSVCPGKTTDPYPSWTSVHPMSLTFPPPALAPAAESPFSNVVSQGLSDVGPASPTLNMFSPVSPMTNDIYTPSNVVSPVTVDRHDPGLGTIEQHEQAASGSVSFGPSLLQSMPEDSDNARSALTSSGSHLPIPSPASNVMGSSATEAQQTKDSLPQQSPHPNHGRFYFEDSDAPSVSLQPCHLGMASSDSEDFIHSIGFDKWPESEASTSMIEPSVKQAITSQSANPVCLPSVSSSASTPQNICAQSGFQYANDIASPLQLRLDLSSLQSPLSMRPPTAVHASLHPPPSNRRSNVEIGPGIQRMGTIDSNTWDTELEGSLESPPGTTNMMGSVDSGDRRTQSAGNIEMTDSILGEHEGDEKIRVQQRKTQEMERSGAWQSLSYSDVQLQSPLDNLIATITSELSSTSPQSYSDISPQQLAAQTDGRGFAVSEALAAKILPHCFNHQSLLASNPAPKHVHVRELRDTVRIVNTEWMQRMTSLPELRLRCSTLLAPTLFEKGVCTLKEYILGTFTQTFDDTVAFVHLAFAAAFLLHWQQDYYSWNSFIDNALQLQHTLSSNEERFMFLKAMECWWLPGLETNPLVSSGRDTSYCSIKLQESLYCVDQETLSDVLRNGEVIKACIGFLDVFERADIGERNHRSPAKELASYPQSRTWKIEHMLTNITRPLLQERGIEALRRIVIDTELQIDSGLLQIPREVEVTLITSARWSSESFEVFERFHHSVTSQSDDAMLFSGLSWRLDWRNDYYAHDLDRILKISDVFDRQHWPDISTLAVTRGQQPILDSPTSSSSMKDPASTLDSSPTSVMSWTSAGSSNTAEVSSQITSPSTLSPDSIYATPLASDTPVDSVVRCPACSRIFNGSPQDAKSNLQRHLRTSRRHNNRLTGLKCPKPECREKPRMRSDNLGPHLQNVHKMSSFSERQAIIDECRLSAKRVDRDGVAQRRSRRE